MNPPVHPEDNQFDPDERPGEDNPPRDGVDPTPSPLGGGVRELDDIQLEALAQRVRGRWTDVFGDVDHVVIVCRCSALET